MSSSLKTLKEVHKPDIFMDMQKANVSTIKVYDKDVANLLHSQEIIKIYVFS